MITRNFTLVSFLILALLTSCAQDNSSNGEFLAKDITLEEFRSMDMDQFNLVDVRTPEEYAEGNIDGSVNINWYDDNFQSLMDQLPTDKATIIYCKSGGRSKSAMKKISGDKFPELYNLLGGYMGYSESKD